MNNIAFVLREFHEHPDITQRQLAVRLDVSLGTVNSLISEAAASKLLSKNDTGIVPTRQGEKYLQPYRTQRAVILAAGFGSRFMPLTRETPKGLLTVFGERMIERQIKQLQEAGIDDIYIMVGYLKEKFEYLTDKYGVKLVYNPEYRSKNTLATLYHARDIFKGHNTYLLNSDNWIRENMYHTYEPCSWYSSVYIEGSTSEWCLSFNRKKLITDVTVGGADSWIMYGPAYFTKEFSESFFQAIEKYYLSPGTETDYWEQVYMDWLHGVGGLDASECPELYINKQSEDQVYEFENLEELKDFNEHLLHSSDKEVTKIISDVLQVSEASIADIRCLKSGMTNRSFIFSLNGKDHICRIPGEGTSQLINRRDEAENFSAVKSLGITENIIYFDPVSGYKISEYYPDARTADADSDSDMKRCMQMLRSLHGSGIKVNHSFGIAERLHFYENLCMLHGEIPYEDYTQVRSRSLELLGLLARQRRPVTMCHIDPVADNFLFINNDSELRLIDWEYAGMADPMIDIAMCAIYSYLDRDGVDRLMDRYFEDEGGPSDDERGIVYAYMSLGGLLWALWAIYKSELGVDFGEYTLIMYRYARDFYRLALPFLTKDEQSV